MTISFVCCMESRFAVGVSVICRTEYARLAGEGVGLALGTKLGIGVALRLQWNLVLDSQVVLDIGLGAEIGLRIMRRPGFRRD